MSLRGRPRKPTLAKVIQGTFRKDRANPAEPRLRPWRIPRNLPKGKGYPEAWREAWRALAPLVNALGVVARSDLLAFEGLVCAVALHRSAEASLFAGGNTSTVYARKDRAGNPYLAKRPEVGMLAQTDRLIATYLARFGMSPADRSRVAALTAPRAADGLDEFRE